MFVSRKIIHDAVAINKVNMSLYTIDCATDCNLPCPVMYMYQIL